MAQRNISDPQVGVLIDPDIVGEIDDSVFGGAHYLGRGNDETAAQALERMLESGIDLLALVGDDRFVGRIVTLYIRQFRNHPNPLRIFVAVKGELTTVADALDAPEHSGKTFRRMMSALREGRLERRMLDTLKISSSARPSAEYGFSFGAGAFYRVFEAYHRAAPSRAGAVASTLMRLAGDAVSGGSAGLEPVRARFAVDGRPMGESLGYLLASSLETSWLGLSAARSNTPGLRLGESSAELVKQVARSRALPKLLRGRATHDTFDRIHLDWAGGYVLDGELYEPSSPYVVQVKKGPTVHFVTL